ncbi:amidohydrolase [Roseateles sp. BYS180W]|uniref:Amidohydrolase n=1 Tax=Roseateles rivi TaxID=3299028 RepID=A0ABW7FX13_9BURK
MRIQSLTMAALAVALAGCAQNPAAPLAHAAATATPMANEAEAADTIYSGGPIVTVNDRQLSAEALAVKNGRIVAVGALADVTRLRGKRTRWVDLQGHVLTPGFVDPHAHFGGFGSQAIGANLLNPPDGDVNTVSDVVQKLREFAQSPDVKRTGWVFGLGYDDALLGRHPTAEDLDQVSTTLPVIAVHISGHFSAVNSVGLKALGYSADTNDPPGGVIRRKAGSREPNGVLEELASIPHMIKAVNPSKPEDIEYFTRRGLELAKSFGYTTAQEGRAFTANHNAFAAYANKYGFEIDVNAYVDYLDRKLLDDSKWFGPNYQQGYRLAGLKITLDGSPQGRTAWRTQPYLLPPDGQQAGYKGYPALADDKALMALYDEAYRKHWQVLTHANGDAAVDQLIRTISPAVTQYGVGQRRNTLIHGQFVREDQLKTLAELGIIPSLFPMHTFYWGDWYEQIVGSVAAQKISPLRTALKYHPVVTSHTDAPVALPNLLQVMDATVNRTSRSGKVMGAAERLTPLEALKTVTLWGAYQHGEEAHKGSLEVGKLADMVVLSDNPLTIEPPRIKTIKVLQTIKEGKTVWQRQP